MKKANVYTTSIIVFILILLGIGGYLLYKRQNSHMLMTYTNTVYGIRFQYPKNYELRETSISENSGTGTSVTLIKKGFAIPGNSEGPTAMTIAMYDGAPESTGGQSRSAVWIATSPYSNFSLSTMNEPGASRIDNQEALLYTWDGLYPATTMVTEHAGNILMFTVTYDGVADTGILRDFTGLIESVDLLEPGSTATSTGSSS